MKVGVFPIINNTHACCLLSFPPSSSLPPLVYLARSGSPSRAFPSLHTHSPRPVPLPPSVARSPLTATSLARPPPPSSPIHLSSLPVFLFPAATTGLRHVFAGDEPTRYAPPPSLPFPPCETERPKPYFKLFVFGSDPVIFLYNIHVISMQRPPLLADLLDLASISSEILWPVDLLLDLFRKRFPLFTPHSTFVHR